MDPNQAIKSCASCGERYAENRDARPSGIKKIGDCRAQKRRLDLLELDALSKDKRLVSPSVRPSVTLFQKNWS